MLSESIFRLEFFTLSKTNISPEKSILKMIFLFQRWDMLVPQRVNPVVSPGRFRKKKHRLRKDGTLQWLHPDAELQVTVHYEAWSIGRLPAGCLGCFSPFLESRFQGIPWKKWCKGWRWIGGVFCLDGVFKYSICFHSYLEKWSILIHVANIFQMTRRIGWVFFVCFFIRRSSLTIRQGCWWGISSSDSSRCEMLGKGG